jgi:hypothetical protein
MTFREQLYQRWSDVVFIVMLSTFALVGIFAPPGCNGCLRIDCRSPSPIAPVPR